MMRFSDFKILNSIPCSLLGFQKQNSSKLVHFRFKKGHFRFFGSEIAITMI